LEVEVDWLKEADNLEVFRKAINGTKEDFYAFLDTLDGATRNKMMGIASTVEEAEQAFADAGLNIQVDAEFI
jgi:hypothetical protein